MTDYDMGISDWSSDVCSSDLLGLCGRLLRRLRMIMVVVMTAAGAMHVAFFFLDRCFQLGAGHVPVGDFRLFQQEIDDLLLIERRADLRLSHRVLLDIFEEPFLVLRARSEEHTSELQSLMRNS